MKSRINKTNIFTVLCICSIFPYCIVEYDKIPEAFFFSIVPIALFLLIKLFGKEEDSSMVKIERLNILCFICSLLFILMLSVSQIVTFIIDIDRYVLISNNIIVYLYKLFIVVWSLVIYFPVLFLCTSKVVHYVIIYSLKNKLQFNTKHITTKRLLAIISIVSVICLVSTYPGAISNPDVVAIWEEVENPSLMNDWHPIGYVYFLWLCSRLFPSVYALNIIQTLIWILLNYAILHFLENVDKTLKASFFYTIISITIFTPYAYLQVMLKDIIFGIMILGMTLFVLKFVNIIPGKIDICFGILVCVGTVLFRHAQIITFLGTMAVLFIWSLIKKDIIRIKSIGIVLLAVLLIYSGVQYAAFNIQGIEKNPKYVSYTVPVAMVGAAAAIGVEFDAEDKETLEEIMPIKKWAECYDKYLMDEISRSWGKIGDDIYTLQDKIENEGYGRELIRINAKLLLQHPIIYLTAFFDANTLVWEIGMPSDSYVQGIQTYKEDAGSVKYMLFWGIVGKIINFQSELPIVNEICTRGGIHLFALVFSIILLWVKKRCKDIIAFVPILLFSVLLMISIPAPQTRYVLGTIECSILLTTYSFFVKEEVNT